MQTNDNKTSHLSTVYDSQIRNTIPFYDNIHAEIMNTVRIIKGNPGVWLDTGAGTGTLISNCMEQFPATRFILADPSVGMLAEARSKFQEVSPDRLLILPPAASGEIQLEAYLRPDVITAVQCHHYLSKEERKATTRACYDLLKEGGVFITFENTRPLTEEGTEYGKQKWIDFLYAHGRTQEETSKHMDRFDQEYFPITVEEHLNLYRECGFRVVELLWFSYMQSGYYCVK